MSAAARNVENTSRTLACARCGASFHCQLDGHCWCAEEDFRLPVPAAGVEDCLCPDCLRAMARATAPK